MRDSRNHGDTIIDLITGHSKPNTGSENNRQNVERLLIATKGYDREDIEVDAPLCLEMDDGPYISRVDLVVRVKGIRYMAIKCAPGALDSREREIVSAARLLDAYQIPLAIASDGADLIVWETVSGRRVGHGLKFLPPRELAEAQFDPGSVQPLPPARRPRVQLVFRSYDCMNVNR
jgi:Type I restriction enzyme R protein N terminus (HSDR_N)